MSHYDNRAIRIRALSVPMLPWEFRAVGRMLQGWTAAPLDCATVWDLEEIGIHVGMLENGRQYIDSVEE